MTKCHFLANVNVVESREDLPTAAATSFYSLSAGTARKNCPGTRKGERGRAETAAWQQWSEELHLNAMSVDFLSGSVVVFLVTVGFKTNYAILF